LLPGWVEEANQRLRARPPLPPAGGPRRAPEVGDLCLAEPVDRGAAEPAIVCVIEVDGDLAVVRAALASPDTDLACDAHFLAPAAQTGLPFDLMISSGITGRLWWFQVARRLGRLDSTLAAWLRDACRRGPGAVPAAVRGMPVTDARNAWRELEAGERGRLAALTADCERALAGGLRALPLVVDPRLLAGLPGDEARSRAARLAAIAGELTIAGRSLIPGRAAAAVVETFDAGGSRLDPDVWRALLPCLERALAAPLAGRPAVTFEPPRAPGPAWADDALAESCDALLAGGARSVCLLTTPQAWAGERPGEPAAAVARSGAGTLQLIHRNLEVSL
jgi:hypothetical protein